jgi:hypothetical protein
MAAIPDGIVLSRHRDLKGFGKGVSTRTVLIVLLLAIPVLALLNVFGQRPSTATASSDAARLSVHSPTGLRGGLIFMARFEVEAKHELKQATLVLDPGWLESITINTIEPSPVGEASHDGKLALALGRVRAGSKYVLYVDFQVNPTNVGRRSQDVALYDGDVRLLTIHRTATIFP